VNIGATIQSRVRQLLQLKGYAPIIGVESVQPVAVIAGFPQQRQPQLEKGDMLVRRFVASMIAPAVVAEYNQIQIRATVGTVLHITRVMIAFAGAAGSAFIGRTANLTSLGAGNAHFVDSDLQFTDIGFTVCDLIRASAAANPTFYGRYTPFTVANAHILMDVDYVLRYVPGNLTGLTVANTGTNGTLYASFEGVAFVDEE
jgi:hypothetical protein